MTLAENPRDVDNENSISKRIRIEVSNDGYQAFATADEANLPFTEMQAALEANGVVYGIDRAAAFEAIQNPGQRTLIASGSRHTDGKDGYLEISNNREFTEGEKKFGIKNIFSGELVGVIHKPTSGSVGVDVYGRKVQPRQGRPINVFTGPSITRTETDDEIRLEATADGNLRHGNASIEIIEEHIINEDVDYSDGEFEFAGSLRIVGDIKGSCRLRIKHDLFVDGSVEDAKISVGGNVTITGSFVGRGDGSIRAGGNADVKVILNQTIDSGGCIRIGKESVNARLYATDSILAKTGIIMGGIVAAGEKVEVLTLGGELYSTTRVKLGIKDLLNEDKAAIDKEMELQSKSIEEMKSEIYNLVRERIDGKNFTAERAEKLKLLQLKLQRQIELVKELAAKKLGAVTELNRKRSPKLTVLGTIHQSVIAEINGVRVPLKQSYQNVTFEELKNDIIRTKNL